MKPHCLSPVRCEIFLASILTKLDDAIRATARKMYVQSVTSDLVGSLSLEAEENKRSSFSQPDIGDPICLIRVVSAMPYTVPVHMCSMKVDWISKCMRLYRESSRLKGVFLFVF